MNANELADELERPNNWQQENNFTTRAATMLRQQQAEIESLKAENSHLKYEISSGAWNSVPLTDEEIYKIANEIEAIQPQHGLRLSNDLNVMDFARAILRKASEK